MQIGTFISAHGCWVYYRQKRRQGVEEGNRFLTFNRDDNVDNHVALVTADNNSGGKLEEKRAGTWGYCMQIIYQVGASDTFGKGTLIEPFVMKIWFYGLQINYSEKYLFHMTDLWWSGYANRCCILVHPCSLHVFCSFQCQFG